MRLRLGLTLGLSALVLACSATALAAPTPPALSRVDLPATLPVDRATSFEIPEKGADLANLSPQLQTVAEVSDESGLAAALNEARATGIEVEGSRVAVIVDALDVATASDSVRALGGIVGDRAGPLVQATIAPTRLKDLAQSPGINLVRPPFLHQPAAVIDEAAQTTNSTFWVSLGLNGSNVDVAIIDGGFQDYPLLQVSGDLPASVSTVDFCAGGLENGEPHGTAVAEAAHKLAPDARLHLICIDDEVGLSNAVTYAINNGVEVINSSIGWFNTSRGDGSGGPGTPDAAVAAARAAGIVWVNAAGNSAQQHWSGVWNDSDGDGFMNFTSDLNNMGIIIPQGLGDCVALKWDRWPTTNQDFDLYLTDFSGTLVAVSVTVQDGSQEPVEALCYTNDADPSGLFLVWISQFSAAQSPRFDLFTYFSDVEFPVPAGSIAEPASSPSALAVGAVCWSNNSLEPFSSRGPTIDGRVKPDLVGPDSASSAIYGDYSTCGETGFAGTSQAAPHVAALAALVKEQNPGFTPAETINFLGRRSLDLGPAGGDHSFGAGLAHVYSFIDAPIGYPLYTYIEEFFARGITVGCGSDGNGQRRFCPEQALPRRGMATFLIRVLGESPFNNPTPTFEDVPPSDPGYGFIERAFQLGLTNGCFQDPVTGVRRYCPDALIMRQGMAAFIVRAKNWIPLDSPSPRFTDVPASHLFYGEIERFAAEGVTTGCSATQYCPNSTTLRRAMAAFIIRAFPAT